jgi:hypothetical protein
MFGDTAEAPIGLERAAANGKVRKLLPAGMGLIVSLRARINGKNHLPADFGKGVPIWDG